MRHLQRRLDAKRATGGDLIGYADRDIEGRSLVGRNFLNDAHRVRRLGAPGIAGEQVTHGICPTDLPWPPDGSHTRNATIGIFCLAVPYIRTRDTNIGSKMKFVTHVPIVAVRDS